MKTSRASTLRAVLALVALPAASAMSQGCSRAEGENIGTNESALRRVQSCGELGDALKSAARTKLNRAVNAQIRGIQLYGWYGGYHGGYYGGSSSSGGAPEAASDASPTAGAGGSSSSGGSGASSPPSSRATESTQTNNQVADVAEADVMQTDQNKYMYVLHGRALKVVDVWPASSMREVATLDLEGSPTEVITSEGQAVVFATVDGTPIYKAAGVSPRDPDYRDPWGATAGGASSFDVPETAPPGGGGSSERYRPITKATVLRFDGTSLAVSAEYYFEGNYLSARRVDRTVRAALQGWNDRLEALTWPRIVGDEGGEYPKTPEEAIRALEVARAKGLSKIDAVDVNEQLPRFFIKNGDAVATEAETCGNYFVPTGPAATGLTRVVGFDMSGAARPRTTSIVAQAETVYSSRDSLYVAAPAWDRDEEWFATWGVEGGDAVSSSGSVGASPPVSVSPPSAPDPAPTPQAARNVRIMKSRLERPWVSINKTNVHKFSFAGVEPLYQGSGRVAGHVLNQFSLDDQDGSLRIATTAQRTNGYERKQDNHVFVMQQQGGELKIVGDVGALAEGERIYSARFLGTKGYVVTFRQVDPLFALDLADPKNPRVTGELKIPGFSSYIHPLGPNHLLTIGRDTNDSSGRVTRGGLKLEIFDVSDAAHPRSAQRWVDDSNSYGYSEAENNHKAFTYFRERELLAFPYAGSDAAGNYTSRLELFRISAAAGILPIGSVDHSDFFKAPRPNGCGWYYDRSVRRGSFFASGSENVVYALSYGGIAAKSVNDLAAKGWALPFTPPTFDSSRYGGGGAPELDCAGGL